MTGRIPPNFWRHIEWNRRVIRGMAMGVPDWGGEGDGAKVCRFLAQGVVLDRNRRDQRTADYWAV